MSSNIVSFVILGISFLALVIFLWKKLPALTQLPELRERSVETLAQNQSVRSFKLPGFKPISPEMVLQKIISRFRVFILKTDSKTSNWLENLRQKSQKNLTDNNYWKELKKRGKL